MDERCTFRPVVRGTLADEGIAWRTVFDSADIEVTVGTARQAWQLRRGSPRRCQQTWRRSRFVSRLACTSAICICLQLPKSVKDLDRITA
ncbi:hypothetical protein SCB29_31865 [Paraburkholderia sp. SIMBA_055]